MNPDASTFLTTGSPDLPLRQGQGTAERIDSLNPHVNDEERAALADEIETEEKEKGLRNAVAAFDLTFSVPKSVSVLWGVTDAGTQALIVDAHHEAVAHVLAMVERDVAVNRAGAHGRAWAVLTKSIGGVAAAAYDHWDSRLGDPQLHPRERLEHRH